MVVQNGHNLEFNMADKLPRIMKDEMKIIFNCLILFIKNIIYVHIQYTKIHLCNTIESPRGHMYRQSLVCRYFRFRIESYYKIILIKVRF